MKKSKENPILFFDDQCLLCNNIIKIILKLERKPILNFGYVNQFPKHRFPAVPIEDSIVLIENGQVFQQFVAARKTIFYLGGSCKILALVMRVIPIFIGNFLYKYIARNRTKWFGRTTNCLMESQIKERLIK